jgi:peptidoglycan/LPS O-acetylase OafA/YrhL
MPDRAIAGFDYLRAIMALAVVALHSDMFPESILQNRSLPEHATLAWGDIIEFNVFALAVPTFIIISIYLFLNKAPDVVYFRDRLLRLSVLYVFWVSLWIYVERLNTSTLAVVLNPRTILPFLVSGANSLYYFLFSLLVLTIVAWCTRRLSRRNLWLLFVTTTALLWILPALVILQPSLSALSTFYSPVNFLPCVFAAGLFLSYKRSGVFAVQDKTYVRACVAFGALWLCTSAIEWSWMISAAHFPGNSYCFPAYTRISVILGSVCVVLLSYTIVGPVPWAVHKFAQLSLGIYCVHPFILRIKLLRHLPWFPFSRFVAIVVLSILVAGFVRFAIRQRVI